MSEVSEVAPEEQQMEPEDLEGEPEWTLQTLTKALKQEAQDLPRGVVRFLVDTYYQVQRYRCSAANQLRSEGGDTLICHWLHGNMAEHEKSIKSLLAHYSKGHAVGRWAESICGIGPVISAGLLAHIDIAHCNTAGKLWAFAGLDPTRTWEKGQKRPHNGDLKVLCWKAGESFVKQSGREADVYGKLYLQRKAYEAAKNEAGDYADQAAAKLEKFRIGKDTEAYKHYAAGKLPPGHIHARAKRWAVKLFLAHWQHVAWICEFGEEPPKPYVISILGHADYIRPPNWPMAV